MKTKLLTLLFTLSLGTSLSQDVELFGFEYATYPKAPITENDSVEISFTEYEVSGLFPVVRKEKFNLLTGGSYRLVIPENNEGRLENNLLFFGLNLTGALTLSGKEKLLISAFPSLSASSGSETFSGDSFIMQGGVFYSKEVSERFSYNVGVISTSQFGSPIFLPFFGMSRIGDKVKWDINLPSMVSATWNYSKRFSYGLKFAVNGSQYNLDGQTPTGIGVDLVRFSRITIGPELSCRVAGPIVFSLYGGVASGRTYEFEFDGFEDVDFSLDNGPFVSLRLSFRPQLGGE